MVSLFSDFSFSGGGGSVFESGELDLSVVVGELSDDPESPEVSDAVEPGFTVVVTETTVEPGGVGFSDGGGIGATVVTSPLATEREKRKYYRLYNIFTC